MQLCSVVRRARAHSLDGWMDGWITDNKYNDDGDDNISRAGRDVENVWIQTTEE